MAQAGNVRYTANSEAVFLRKSEKLKKFLKTEIDVILCLQDTKTKSSLI